MRNLMRTFVIVAVWTELFLWTGIPVNAAGNTMDRPGFLPESPEDISYLVDFLDYDGNFLDSKICTCGQKLEDIIVPERAEDEEYTYRFTGWEPELCEVVTESAAYIAVYEKIPKDGTDPIVTEVSSNSVEKAVPEKEEPKGPDFISAISYDVVPIHIETPKPEKSPDDFAGSVGKIGDFTVPAIHVPAIITGKEEPANEKIAEKAGIMPEAESPENLSVEEKNPELFFTEQENAENTEKAEEKKNTENTDHTEKIKKKEVKIPDRTEREDSARSQGKEMISEYAESKQRTVSAAEEPEVMKASFGRQKQTQKREIPILPLLLGAVVFGAAVFCRVKRSS